jgi:hypothetical protein
MHEDDIDILINSVEEDIKNQQAYIEENPPKITGRDKGQISVIFGFNYGAIPNVKFRATYDRWVDLQFSDIVTFETIEDDLSRPSRGKKLALKRYSEESPLDFEGDVELCAQGANLENPKYKPSTKPRKNLYGLTKKERWDISSTAVRLYSYLCDTRKLKPYPSYLNKFLNHYEVEYLGNDLDVQEIIPDILSQWYDIDFGDRFWQSFVTEGPVSVKRVRQIAKGRINPLKDPFLRPLFTASIE